MDRWQPTSGEKSELWSGPEKVVSDAWASLRRLEEDRGLHQIIDVADHVAHGHDLSRLVSRCLISSSFVVLKMPRMLYRKQGPDEYLAGLRDGWDMSAEQRRLERLVTGEGIPGIEFCVVLPESMAVSAEVSGGDALDGEFERAGEVNAKIRQLESYVYSLPVGADYGTVRRLLRQDSSHEPLTTGVLMPEIQNLSLGDLARLRRDYDGAFARLRYSLKRYLDGVAEADKESKLVGVIEEIDHECRKAEDEFKSIERKHSRSLTGMLITTSVVALAAAGEVAMPGVLAAAMAAVGSVTVKDLMERRIAKMNDAEDMEKSDYWIAWKIHEENRKRAGRGK
ncbi:MAG: hypothetical protein FJW40_01530 [Acidobacteria bacterium]|nr:hypothetical protein [Acidobacteriota bacterium]